MTIDKKCSGLIIAKGNVTVNRNFNGLIIASGKVIIGQPVVMKSDLVLVSKLLSYAKSDEDLSKLFGMENSETHNTTVSEECLRYLNWEKNTY